MYYSYSPPPPLAAFVNHFWVYEGEATSHGKERRLPNGSIELVIHLHDESLRVCDGQREGRFQSLGQCVVSGAYSTFFMLDTACHTSLVGISFKPGGTVPFFSLPASELYNAHVSLETLWGAFAGELRERLLALQQPGARLRLLEQFLLARTTQALLPSPMLTFALAELQKPAHTCTIAELTERIGYSSRHFSQVFSAAVGLTPKQFYRVRRFQEVLSLIEESKEIVWSDLAALCGYFDQAHFIHDFRDFSGLTPGTYLTHRGEFRNHIPLLD